MSFDTHDNEFEHWLRDQTERHRLFADESVWNRIQNRINRRRWYPVVLSLLLITSGAVSWVMMTNPSNPSKQLATHIPSIDRADRMSELENDKGRSTVREMSPFKKTAQSSSDRSKQLSFLRWTKDAEFATENDGVDVKNNQTIDRSNSIAATEIISSPEMMIQKPISVDLSKRIGTAPAVVSMRHTTPETINPPSNEEVQDKIAATTNDPISPEQIQTIESVVNAYKGKRTKKSWNVQFNVSPTVSYRKLIEDAGALQAARSAMSPAPAMAAPEIENVVNHKPDLGLQMGLSVHRQLTDRIAFVGGLQFNINKYDIQAYTGSREVATVGLNSGGGTGSVSSYTNYRSSGGAWANWLANFYFSASAPVGFQVRLAGNKKWNWGIGSTLQPTCILSNHTYVLSTDYKNYLEVPSLVRRWNMNGQVESFIGFQGKKTRFTLGPQARYQILSSFEKAYPVKEHLFDIGIKLGVGL